MAAEHESITIKYPNGDKSNIANDDHRDKDGTWTLHHEETIEENGKCEKLVIDETEDSHGKIISHTEKTLACNQFNLEMSEEGTLTAGSGTTLHWGPETALIPLDEEGGTYSGNYSGQFNVNLTGTCQLASAEPSFSE